MNLLKEMSVIIVLFKGEFFCRKNRRSSTYAKRLGCAPFILFRDADRNQKSWSKPSVQQVAHFEITLQQKSKWRCIFCPHRFVDA